MVGAHYTASYSAHCEKKGPTPNVFLLLFLHIPSHENNINEYSYEVNQKLKIKYRIYFWNRRASIGLDCSNAYRIDAGAVKMPTSTYNYNVLDETTTSSAFHVPYQLIFLKNLLRVNDE